MDRAYFDSMYAGRVDPWGFETRFYERRKYDLTLAALGRPTYGSAFEPGCSNGVLTERLAARCERLVATDIVGVAVERARERVRHLDHVEVVEARFPDHWPDDPLGRPLDLVVWSEVAYYLAESSLDDALTGLDERLGAGGELVVVNYTGDTNHPRTADDVDEQVDSSGLLTRTTTLRCEQFRLDVWRR